MIRFSCPNCGHTIKASDDDAGKTGKCRCGERVRVPSPHSSLTDEASSPPRSVRLPPSDPDALPDLPEWLANAYPNASPAVLRSLREWWRDTQEQEREKNIPTSQPPTASPSTEVGEPSLQYPTPAPGYYARTSTRSGAVGVPLPPCPTPASPPPTVPKYPNPTGEMILCYACRKPLADTALTCPACGAVQNSEGKEKGRQLKKQEQWFAMIVALLIAVPFFSCCFMGLTHNSRDSSPSLEQRVPAGWDMDKLKRDADDVARDPSKTIFIPKDGSQPRVVPNPFQDPGP